METAQSRRRLTPVSTRTGSVLINGHGTRSAPGPEFAVRQALRLYSKDAIEKVNRFRASAGK